jgi:hypothetical protein
VHSASLRRVLVLSRGARCACAPPCKQLWPLYPRGPRSGPGYSVPVHPHLLGPIRPTRKHISISPTRLIRDVLAVRRTSTPRRPTSGSVLSLAVLYRHVALQDPGKPAGCSYPVLHRPRWPSTLSDGLGTSITLHPPILVEESISRLNYGSHALQPADLLAPLSEQTRLSPSLRGLLHPGFRRIGRPHRRRTSLQWQLGKFHRRDLHPLERQLASLQPITRLERSRSATDAEPSRRFRMRRLPQNQGPRSTPVCDYVTVETVCENRKGSFREDGERMMLCLFQVASRTARQPQVH